MLTPHFQNIRQEIISSLQTAEQRVDIAVSWFKDLLLFNTLGQLLDKKPTIAITLIISKDDNNFCEGCLDFNKLINKGLKLYLATPTNLMHHKFCIIDQKTLLTGTYNWTNAAAQANYENILKVTDEPELLSAFIQTFETLKTVTSFTPTIDFTFESVKAQYSVAGIFEYQHQVEVTENKKLEAQIQEAQRWKFLTQEMRDRLKEEARQNNHQTDFGEKDILAFLNDQQNAAHEKIEYYFELQNNATIQRNWKFRDELFEFLNSIKKKNHIEMVISRLQFNNICRIENLLLDFDKALSLKREPSVLTKIQNQINDATMFLRSPVFTSKYIPYYGKRMYYYMVWADLHFKSGEYDKVRHCLDITLKKCLAEIPEDDETIQLISPIYNMLKAGQIPDKLF